VNFYVLKIRSNAVNGGMSIHIDEYLDYFHNLNKSATTVHRSYFYQDTLLHRK